MLTRAALVSLVLAAPCGAATVFNPDLKVDLVAQGLGTGMGHLTTAFVFVDAQTILAVRRDSGQVRRIDLAPGRPPTVAQPGPVVLDLDIIAPNPGDTQSEYGVQAMACHPDFAANRLVYIRYDRSLTEGRDTPQDDVVLGRDFSASVPTVNVIDRFIWDPVGASGQGALVFDCRVHRVTFDTRYHHGGSLVFDPDGMLYSAYGDLRHWVPDWVPGHSGMYLATNVADGQVDEPATIIRLHADGSVPLDNPFSNRQRGVPGKAATWFGYGSRNSWSLAVDPANGNLWQTDNGEARFDEINLVPPGFNGGHKWIMGPVDHPTQPGSLQDLVMLPGAAYVDPRFAWLDGIGVTALHFLHGSALGAPFDDRLLVGTYNTGYLWAFRLNSARDDLVFVHPDLQDHVDDRPVAEADPVGTAMEEVFFGDGFGGSFSGILAIQRGWDNLPYVLTASGELHRIRRISARPCMGDVDQSGIVAGLDLAILLGHWTGSTTYKPCPPHQPADLNHDCTVNGLDLALLLGAWGPCP